MAEKWIIKKLRELNTPGNQGKVRIFTKSGQCYEGSLENLEEPHYVVINNSFGSAIIGLENIEAIQSSQTFYRR